MTADQLTLIAAVLANPADDLPRLVYADWLEEPERTGTVECRRCEGYGTLLGCAGDKTNPTCPYCHGHKVEPNGFPERAEFIRVQIELARLEAVGWHDEWKAGVLTSQDPIREHGEKIAALRQRERALLTRENVGEWLPDLTGLGKMIDIRDMGSGDEHHAGWCNETTQIWIEADFRRGFVSEITCTAADWLTHADALTWRPEQTAKCKGCATCKDGLIYTGMDGMKWIPHMVPRPCPPTAQPVTTVRLTAVPEFDGRVFMGFTPSRYDPHPAAPPTNLWMEWLFQSENWGKVTQRQQNDKQSLTTDRWPGITFELPEASHFNPNRWRNYTRPYTAITARDVIEARRRVAEAARRLRMTPPAPPLTGGTS